MADSIRVQNSNSSRLYLLNATQSILLPNGEELLRHSSITNEIETMTTTDSLLNATNWQFRVEGSSGKEYNVYMDTMIANCSCPDCSFRNKVCKHIYFIVGRVAQYTELLNEMSHDDILQGLLTADLNERLVNRIFMQRKKQEKQQENKEETITLEDVCPVCFENEFVTTNTVFCPHCEKAIHTSCMRMWWNHKKTTCPLCRGQFMPPSRRNNDRTHDECLSKLVNS